MPIRIEKDNDGLVVIRAAGTLAKQDYPPFTAEFERLTHECGKLKILFDITGFDGWDPKGVWEEAKFDLAHNSDIRRIAVIGDEKWHHALVATMKPFAAAEVRYFHPSETNEARTWLSRP